MRLALDAMGGDHAPRAMVQGAVDYARQHPNHTVQLVGITEQVQPLLTEEGGKGLSNIELVHAPEVIGMAEKLESLRERPNDSMNVASRLVKEGRTDGMVLCGNTGCSAGAAQMHLRRIRGIKRAAILTPLPNAIGTQTWVIDCGANAVGKPEHLLQFAQMTATFLQHYAAKQRPTVGLLNIGEEEGKGDDLTAETLALLRATDLNLIGNVEGNDIFTGEVDIVVCDGFTGNVVLKTAEGVSTAIRKLLRTELERDLRGKLGGLLARPAFTRVRKQTHWSEVGGCLLLGVNGVCIIGHGRSDRTAVRNALGQAARCVETQAVKHLQRAMENLHGTDAAA